MSDESIHRDGEEWGRKYPRMPIAILKRECGYSSKDFGVFLKGFKVGKASANK